MMKHIKFIVIILIINILSNNLSAQDIIITRDQRKIEAKILKIETNSIEYVRFNTDLPVYSINKNDVLNIIFQDGMVENYGQLKSNTEITAETTKEIKHFNTLDDKEVLEYLRTKDPELYEQFHKAMDKRRKGKALLGSGIVFEVVGGIVFGAGITSSSTNAQRTATIGALLSILGEALIIASIPTSASAGVWKKNIKNEYVRKLQLKTGQYGLGLSYSF
jgi:hypothetical protein